MKKSILPTDAPGLNEPSELNESPELNDVVGRIARRSLEARGAGAADEVRRLLDAGREVMRRSGTRTRPKVADIVASAGLSNDAFYRYFASKDALVAAILEDGTVRLRSYLGHQMVKSDTAEGQVRRWVEGVLSQAVDEDVAATTLAVLWNGGSLGEELATARPSPSVALAVLLHQPLTDLGSRTPDVDAVLIAHAVVGLLSDHLWNRTRPDSVEIDRVVAFCLSAIGEPGPGFSERP